MMDDNSSIDSGQEIEAVDGSFVDVSNVETIESEGVN